MTGTTFDIDAIEAGSGETLTFADGIPIYTKDEPGDCAYMVKSGRVRIGNGVPIEVMQAGEIFGEMALIDNDTRSASAIAVGRVELIPIDRGMFEVLVRDDCDFAMTVMRLMARRLRLALGMLANAQGHGHAMDSAAIERPSRLSA